MNKYGKYFKDIAKYLKLDIYRILDLYKVTDHTIGHAVKKLLLAGDRTGGKSLVDDVTEARDTLNRWLEMREEDLTGLPTTQPVLREYTLEEVTRGVTLSSWATYVAVDADGHVYEYEKKASDQHSIGTKWNSEVGSRYRRINKVVPPINFKNCLFEVVK